jgi:hypothetical protein
VQSSALLSLQKNMGGLVRKIMRECIEGNNQEGNNVHAKSETFRLDELALPILPVSKGFDKVEAGTIAVSFKVAVCGASGSLLALHDMAGDIVSRSGATTAKVGKVVEFRPENPSAGVLLAVSKATEGTGVAHVLTSFCASKEEEVADNVSPTSALPVEAAATNGCGAC